MKFLDAVAERVLAAGHPQLHRVLVLFPSVRPVEPFRQSLGRLLKAPSLSPICRSFDEWVFEQSERSRPNRLWLQDLLYQAYLQCSHEAGVVPDHPETFLSWAGGLLQDFEEIDQHLLDADKVFGHLHQQKAVELWSPSDGQLTETEAEYLHFFSLLGPTYHAFRKILDDQGLAYPSSALRALLEHAEEPLEHLRSTVDAIYWVGFDSPDPGLQRLLQVGSKSIPMFWITEGDAYYVTDPLHSAGMLWRDHPLPKIEKLKVMELVGERLLNGEPRFEACRCMGMTEQLDEGLELIQKWIAQGVSPARIAWVLADANQAWPLMLRWSPLTAPPVWNLPLDLRWTASYAWAMGWIELQQSLHYTGKVSVSDWNRWIESPISHPEWSEFKSPKKGVLFRKNLQSLTWNQQSLLPHKDHADDAYLHLAELIEQVLENHPQLPEMEQHALMKLAEMIRVLAPRIPESENRWTLWRKLWNQNLSSAALNPGHSEPNGVRITTLDRTKALDFDYLIVSGANEGLLPKPGRYSGMLSFDLRRAFGLPDPWIVEARQAYEFYRLLQHCTEAQFLWSATGTDGKAAESSRYLQQLELEYPGPFHNRERRAQTSSSDTPWTLLEIPKSPRILSTIAERLETRALSPSTFSAYLECPLKFWYKYVRNIHIPDEETEQLNAAQTGNLLHETLEKLFEPLIGALMTPSLLRSLMPQVEQAWKEVRQKNFPWQSFEEGLNAMVDRMGPQFIHQYLTTEAKAAQRKPALLIGQERPLETSILVDEQRVKWRGRLDRLEQLNGRTRIVDFKSGILKNNASELRIKGIETCFDGEHSKAFQLMCYAWMAYRSDPEAYAQGLELAILPLQQAEGGPRLLEIDQQSLLTVQSLEEFESLLLQHLREMMDPDRPFEATTQVRKCTYCDFNRICQRQPED
jgi:RecB family exonuclease